MQVYTGIDWSESKYDVVFMNQAGAVIARLTIRRTLDGFLQLDAARRAVGVDAKECVVGLETAHNLMVDFLWSRGYGQLYVIPPRVVNGNRSRFGQSGARTDLGDALLIAEILRTDRGQLQPWRPDTLLTRQLRAKVGEIGFLTRQIVRTSNRLRSILLRYYPAALNLFCDMRTQIRLVFIQTYPTPQAAAALTFEAFRAFAVQQGYHQLARLRKYYTQLQGTHPQATSETVLVFQEEAVQLATLLLRLVQSKSHAKRTLATLFAQHPDAPYFASLPGAGELLAPSLLAKFGDDRRRFPKPASVQALAGTCPVTEKSGKSKVVRYRKACDREFRDIAQKWAKASLSESLWANAYWHRVRPHCRSNSHALRCLANRWLSIAWAIWQKRERHDETYHMQQRTLHSRERRYRHSDNVFDTTQPRAGRRQET